MLGASLAAGGEAAAPLTGGCADPDGVGALVNGRSLASVAPGAVAPRCLYRSAAPARSDALPLPFAFRTVVDFRRGHEKRREDGASHALASRSCTVIHQNGLNGAKPSGLADVNWCKFCCLQWSCQGKRAEGLIIAEVMKPENMLEMYKLMLADCGAALCETLEVCANRENYPLLFHCSSGRDRTGVTAMLIEHIAGVPREGLVRCVSLPNSPF